MSLRLQKLVYILPIAAALLLLLIFSNTTPLQAGAGGILVVFFLLYVFWASLFFIFLHVGLRFIGRIMSRRKNINAREWRIGVQKSYYIASVLAFAPVLLLAMQSVGQLQVRDVLLVVALISLVIFYVVKRT